MSATTRHIPPDLRGAGHAPAPPAARALAIAWPISPRALVAAPAAAAVLNGHAARLAACSLVWTIEGRHASAALELTLDSGERDVLVLLAGAPARWLAGPETGLLHVEVLGLLHATVRPTPERAGVLFARTSLLGERLGLPGGVYDPPCSRDA